MRVKRMITKEMRDRVYALASEGLTDLLVANGINVSVTTFSDMRHRNAKLEEALQSGKAEFYSKCVRKAYEHAFELDDPKMIRFILGRKFYKEWGAHRELGKTPQTDGSQISLVNISTDSLPDKGARQLYRKLISGVIE